MVTSSNTLLEPEVKQKTSQIGERYVGV